MSGRRRAVAALGLLAFAFAASAARADDPDEVRARDAYDRGTSAYRRADYARAAAQYALADSLAPSPVALRAALDAATLADDSVLGTELMDRAASRDGTSGDKQLADVVAAARARFAHRAGHLVVRCPEGCLATVDGATLHVGRARAVAIGTHTVVVQTDAGSETRIVHVDGDQVVEVSPGAAGASSAPALATRALPATSTSAPTSPATRDALSEREHQGGRSLPPALFYVALGATAVAAGFATWSGIDTADRHSRFVGAGCSPSTYSSSCVAMADGGRSAQTRTNVLLTATGVLGVATAALGLFVVRF
jgi:hypothetical protein